MYQFLEPCHTLTDHVSQFPWRLCFPVILRRVFYGDDPKDFADGIRVVAVIVSVFGYNLVVGDADLRSPGLLRRPLCVGEDNDRLEVAL